MRGDKQPSAVSAEEAAAWWLAARIDAELGFDQAAYQGWLASDPAHGRAMAALERSWNAVALLEPRELTPRRGRRAAITLAGGGVAALVATSLIPPHPFADLRTGVGERRSAQLPDGSQVELSTDTALSIRMTPERRLVRLAAGEAFFQVAPDPARPFVVQAGEGSVTALGTAFAVALDGEGAEVTVTEHRVAVEAAGRRLEVGAGQRVGYSGQAIGSAVEADPAIALAWRQGSLIFMDAPLAQVIEVIGRWRRERVVLLDGALRDRRVSAIIDLRSPSLLEPLAASLPIRLTRIGPVTLVRQRG